MVAVDAALPTHLQEEVGDGLRTVATYEERDYTFHHFRNGLLRRYSRADVEAILDDLIIEGLSTQFVESLFHAGDLECAIYGFEEAVMFHFVLDDGVGLFGSFDRDSEHDLDALISTCKRGVLVAG